MAESESGGRRFSLDQTVRQEIIDRLKQRDTSFTLFATVIAALLAYASQQGDSNIKVLIIVPYLALGTVSFSCYHDIVIEYLHEYLKTTEAGWETSEERKAYANDVRKHFLTLSQIAVFTGGSAAALGLTISTVSGGTFFLWLLGLILTVISTMLILYVRVWRHSDTEQPRT